MRTALIEPYLQFLRDWLPFSRRTASTPESEELRRWLNEFAYIPPAAAARKLAARLPALLAENGNLHVRLRILDDVYSAADALLPDLEAAIDRATLPLSNDGHFAAVAADNLLKALASGYVEVINTIEMQRLAAGLVSRLRIAIERAMECLAGRQMLAHQAYAPTSANAWQQLHRLYRVAHMRGLHSDAPASIELKYLAALLVAFADPTKFARSDLPELRGTVGRLALLARIVPAGTADLSEERALFVVKDADSRAGHRLARTSEENLTADDWIVDCTEMVGALRKEIAALDLTGLPAGNPSRLPVLKKLLTMWQGQPTRRFNRMRFKPRGDLVIGLPNLLRTLGNTDLLLRHDNWLRHGCEHGLPVSEWIIIDESPDGFGVRYAKGDVGQLEVGELVGLRPRERNRIHICLVRRITNAGAARFELGLQELSPTMVGTQVAVGAARHAGALFVPSLPGFNGVPGLLTLPGILDPGLEISLPIDPRQHRLRIVRALERHPRCELFLVQRA